MNSLLAPAPAYALAGLKSLLVGPWVAGADYVYASPELDIITELDPAAVFWRLDCSQAPNACEFGEMYGRDKNGDAYTQTITAAVPGLDVLLRAGLQNLVNRPLLALCQDMRGQWWLYGQDGTLRLPTYAAKGGPGGGETLTNWSLSGRQSAAARLVVLAGPVQVIDQPFPTVPNPGTIPTPGPTPTRSAHALPFVLAGDEPNPAYSTLA